MAIRRKPTALAVDLVVSTYTFGNNTINCVIQVGGDPKRDLLCYNESFRAEYEIYSRQVVKQRMLENNYF